MALVKVICWAIIFITRLTKRVALLCYVQCDWVLSGYFSQTLSAQTLSARGN